MHMDNRLVRCLSVDLHLHDLHLPVQEILDAEFLFLVMLRIFPYVRG